MTVAVFNRVELRCSVFVLLLFPLAVVFDRLDTLLVFVCSLIVHELAHSIMAHRLGFSVCSIELQPFGCVARLRRSPSSPSESAVIAAAGPLISLLLSLCAAGLIHLSGRSAEGGALSEFAFFNLTLGAGNLVPVLPLDGGRLALAAVSAAGRGRRRAFSALFCFGGVLTGLISTAAGAYSIFVLKEREGFALTRAASLMITGGFIALSALRERRDNLAGDLRTRLAAPKRLENGASVRVLSMAMSKNCTVRDALMAVSGSSYGVVYVVDDDMRTLSMLDEGALMAAAVRGGSGERLESLLNNE